MERIDLHLLNLTTPKPSEDGGSLSTTYPPGQFVEDEFYRQGETGELILWAPVVGASTKSTTRTRTELRETLANGTTFNWRMDSADHHWLQTSVVVREVPEPSGETVVSQIHVKDSSRPMLKVSYDDGRIVVGFRAEFDQVDPVDTTILSNVPLNTRLALSVHLTATGQLSVSASYTLNGVRVDGKAQLTAYLSWNPKLLYFKFGVYNQQSPSPTTPADTGSLATYWKASIRHE
jgi:hypothetical protein